MGKLNGFLDIERQVSKTIAPKERIKNFKEFHIPLTPDQQSLQGARCMDCGVPFCQSAVELDGIVTGCPLNNLVPEWNDLITKGHYRQAAYRLLKTNNFPEFTSRVCPALCEAACTCGLHGEAVSVHENEYAIIEEAFDKGWIQPLPPLKRNDYKIAVVGSGPAGLAVADQLNKRGYHVTVFERDDRVGGLLMYGIPNMKLEKHIIERRIAIMEAEGVQFKTNSGIETKAQAEQLQEDFDRVVLACGTRLARDIPVTNRDAKGIYFAVDYLTNITKSLLDHDLKEGSFIETKGKKVLVIGGGDTGNDCVGTAIRLGCQDVIQLEMMPELPTTRSEDNPWPTWPRIKKTDYGQVESLAVFDKDPRQYQTTVKEFIKNEQGHVCGAILLSLQKDENNRMVPVAGSEKEIEVDLVFIAAGFIGAQKHVTEAFDVEMNERNCVVQTNHRTTKSNIYVAGDMKRGQSLVVWAIREGRDVAKVVDYDCMGYTNLR
ncbi:glutamate synthase subunit beta [Tannockella kyphosi]|uniref:glutamate synthase subunit beta n=1 Tax=Tannockella kyphosi TaxID=2899121 RepID=UPI0020125BEF|nr:glutamate synthase subunit beta [Tannockella kyphosi]